MRRALLLVVLAVGVVACTNDYGAYRYPKSRAAVADAGDDDADSGAPAAD